MGDYIVDQVKDFDIWKGPEHGQDNGVTSYSEGFLYYAIFQIKSFPDLSLNKDLSNFDFQQRDKVVYGYQQKFVDTLHKIGNERTSFSLRYILNPEQSFENKITLFFIVRMFSEKKDEEGFLHIVRQISNVFPTDIGIYHAPIRVTNEQRQREVIDSVKDMKYIAEIRKKEKIYPPFWDTENLPPDSPYHKIKYFYIPFNYAPQLNTMIPTCETLVKQTERTIVDISIIPTALTQYEQHILKILVTNYDKLQREQKITIESEEKETEEVPADPIIKIVFDTFKNCLHEYAASGVFLLSCRAASNNVAAVESVTMVMGRNSAKDFDYEVLDPTKKTEWESSKIALLRSDISIATRNNEIWDMPNSPSAIKRLHRMGGSSEVGAFFKLPIPSIQGVPGFPITSRPQGNFDNGAGNAAWYKQYHEKALKDKTINLGNIGLRGERLQEELSIKIKDLAKHGLIVGVPGSGKTTTCFHILYQLWNLHKIPFLVIEPAKTEYRALKALKGMDDLLVFSLGDENCSPFRFNPFEVLPKISLEKHISNLEACFRGALPLDGPLPFLLSEALEQVYMDRGWQFTHVGTANKQNWPMMMDLYQKLIDVINQKGYSGEVLSNVRTALEVRVGGLLRRSIGRMLNTFYSVPPELIMSKPVVVELDPLNDEQQALMTMFILNMVKEYVRTTRKSGTELKHVILLEEAHNLLGHVPISHEQGNPKAEAVKYFTKMLAEMRALGEGIIVADQLPSALHSSVIKNTNLKIMHRLTSEDDRVQLGNTMLLDAEQFIKAVTLTPGESYIYKEGLERPKQVFEPNFKDDFKISEPPDDDSMRKAMEDFRNENISVFMPFVECGMCCETCNDNYRYRAETTMEVYAKAMMNSISLISSHSASVSKSSNPFAIKLKEFEESNQKCFCLYELKKFLRDPKFLMVSKNPKQMMFCLYVHFLHKAGDLIKQASKNKCKCQASKRKEMFEIFWISNNKRISEALHGKTE